MIIEVIYLVLIIFAIVQVILAIREFGKSSVGQFFWHFLTIILMLGGIRLFFYFVDINLIPVSDATLMFVWHFMFYITIGVFILVNRSLISLVSEAKLINPFVLGLISFLLMVGLFLIAIPINPWVMANIDGTWWMRSGIFHFVAFVFAGFVAGSLFTIKRKFSDSIGTMATPLLISVSILSLIHLWELLNESWEVVKVSETVGEGVERILWIFVYLFVAYAFYVARKSSQPKT